MKETRVRYIHHDNSGSERCAVAYANDGDADGAHHVSVVGEGSCTVLVEVKHGELVRKLRIMAANLLKLEPSWLDSYEFIQELDVECAVPIKWIFRHLPFWTSLQTVRFGKAAFQEVPTAKEFYQYTLCCPSVETFELESDPELYRQMSDLDRELMRIRIQSCIRGAQFSFPGLKFCRLIVPLEMEGCLQFFIDFFPEMKRVGEKRTRYGDGSITFISKEDERRGSREPSVEPVVLRPIPRRCSAPAHALHSRRTVNQDELFTAAPGTNIPNVGLSPSSPRGDPSTATTFRGLQRRATVGSSAPKYRSISVSPVLCREGSLKVSGGRCLPAIHRSLHP